MNAYVQEWIWRFSRATGVAKYVFLAIGRRTKRTPKGEFETGPLPVDVIAGDTGLVDSTVRKHVKDLADAHGELDIVRDSRRGEAYRYRLRRQLRIPLDADSPSAHRRLTAVTPPNLGDDDTAESRRCDRLDTAVTAPKLGGDAPGVPFSSNEEVRTEVPTTSKEQEVADFLDWFHRTYREQRGIPYHVKPAAAEAVTRRLLADRSVARLQAMAVLMFDAVRDAFITTSDYSLFVLEHKATYLESIVVVNERDREAVG